MATGSYHGAGRRRWLRNTTNRPTSNHRGLERRRGDVLGEIAGRGSLRATRQVRGERPSLRRELRIEGVIETSGEGGQRTPRIIDARPQDARPRRGGERPDPPDARRERRRRRGHRGHLLGHPRRAVADRSRRGTSRSGASSRGAPSAPAGIARARVRSRPRRRPSPTRGSRHPRRDAATDRPDAWRDRGPPVFRSRGRRWEAPRPRGTCAPDPGRPAQPTDARASRSPAETYPRTCRTSSASNASHTVPGSAPPCGSGPAAPVVAIAMSAP